VEEAVLLCNMMRRATGRGDYAFGLHEQVAFWTFMLTIALA
jgi:hypothetical protein